MKRGLATVIILAVCALAHGAEFRRFRPIPTPKRLPRGAQPVRKVKPVDPKAVKQAVKELMASWNKGDLGEKLGEKFYDRERLLDSISEKVPRDASLRVMGVRNIQVLQQYTQPSQGAGGGAMLTSRVSVTVQTQIEFNEPNGEFRRIDGVNEFIFEVTTKPKS